MIDAQPYFYSLSSSGAMVVNTLLADYLLFMDSLVQQIIQVGLTLFWEGPMVIVRMALAVMIYHQVVTEFYLLNSN